MNYITGEMQVAELKQPGLKTSVTSSDVQNVIRDWLQPFTIRVDKLSIRM